MEKSLTQFLILYAQEIVNNKRIEGNNIKLACQRFLNDLKRDDLIWVEEKAVRVVKFASCFKHYKGTHSGKHFLLSDWEVFIVANIFGWYVKSTGLRRFQQSYIEIARKNGKTFLAAVLCLYALIADGEDGAEVLLAANCKDQATLAFEVCTTLAKQVDPLARQVIPYKWKIAYTKNNSILRVLAADDTKLDGFNSSFALIDRFLSM